MSIPKEFALHVWFTLVEFDNRHYTDLNNVRDSGVLVQGTPCTPEREIKLNLHNGWGLLKQAINPIFAKNRISLSLPISNQQ